MQNIRSGNSISGKQINEIKKIISMYPLFVHEQLHVHSTNFEKKLNQIKTKLNNHKRSSHFTCSNISTNVKVLFELKRRKR